MSATHKVLWVRSEDTGMATTARLSSDNEKKLTSTHWLHDPDALGISRSDYRLGLPMSGRQTL
jgi:hypothetical protein